MLRFMKSYVYDVYGIEATIQGYSEEQMLWENVARIRGKYLTKQ